MGNEPLTRKILEEILHVKLSLLKGTIKELTDKMAEFCKFTDEAKKKYEETNTRMSDIEKVYSTNTARKQALKWHNTSTRRANEAALKVKKGHNYDHIWTSTGTIYVWKDWDSSAIL